MLLSCEQILKLCAIQLLAFDQRISQQGKLIIVFSQQLVCQGFSFVKNALYFSID